MQKSKIKKKLKQNLNKMDISQFKIFLKPVALSVSENNARLKRLCRLIYPHLASDCNK